MYKGINFSATRYGMPSSTYTYLRSEFRHDTNNRRHNSANCIDMTGDDKWYQWALNESCVQEALNNYLADYSYLEDYTSSQLDLKIYRLMKIKCRFRKSSASQTLVQSSQYLRMKKRLIFVRNKIKSYRNSRTRIKEAITIRLS